MNWSFQLYSARKFQPWDGVLKMLAEVGYENVEGFGGLYEDPAGLRAALDANGLAMPTAHFSLDLLERDFESARKIAETLGVKWLICPHITADLRPSDAAGWRDFAGRLEAVGAKARAAGLDFAWHNHDFEFQPLADGSLPMTLILENAPGIGFEFDIAWAIRGGADPMPFIDRFGDRIVAVHVKDIAAAGFGLDEDGWSDVGHGTVDWAGLVAALREKTATHYYVMEQDNPNDIDRFARRSLETVKTF